MWIKQTGRNKKNYIDEHIAEVQEEENIPHKYKKVVMLISEAAKELIQRKLMREERNPWITADI